MKRKIASDNLMFTGVTESLSIVFNCGGCSDFFPKPSDICHCKDFSTSVNKDKSCFIVSGVEASEVISNVGNSSESY